MPIVPEDRASATAGVLIDRDNGAGPELISDAELDRQHMLAFRRLASLCYFCGEEEGRHREPCSRPRPIHRAQGGTSRYGRRALESEVGRVIIAPVGGRNHALNRAAYSLGQLVAGGELDIDEAYDALRAAGLRCGLGDIEVKRTLESGITSGMETPRTAPR